MMDIFKHKAGGKKLCILQAQNKVQFGSKSMFCTNTVLFIKGD